MKTIKIVLMTTVICIALMFINTKVLATNTGITENDTTRLREKASTSSGTVTLISMNQKVEIISEKGDWYNVKYTSDGKTYSGYIRKDMLKVDDKNKKEVKKEETKTKDSTENKDNTDNQKVSENIEVKEGSISKINNDIEIRILPLITSNKTETINKNTNITIKEIVGNWCYIETENQNGWAMKSQLESNTSKVENKEEKEESKKETTNYKTLYVSTETVNLREKAESNSNILLQLPKNTAVTQIEKKDNTWSKVKVGKVTGYIANSYLSDSKVEVTSRGSNEAREEQEEKETKKEPEKKTETETKKEEVKKSTEKKTETKKEEKKESTKEKTVTSNSTSKSSGNKIVSTAKKYLGYRYVSGGSSPKSGFDCSGFTSYVYKVNGYSINRVSSAQASNGKKVSKSNLQAGDLVLFKGYSGGSIGHVGIYIGGNKFIHAANQRKGVIVTSLSDSYYAKRYVTARRIIN